MSRKHRTDGNHRRIMRQCRDAFMHVDDVSALGGLGADLIVGFQGKSLLVEIKRPGHEHELTESERDKRDTYQGAWIVATSFDDIRAWFEQELL